MSTGIAPVRLPFAPRPISTELLSSWLLRVAAANCVDLGDLLHGLECRYGAVLTNRPIDFGLPDAAVQALSKFCQVAPAKIRALDLRQRSPYLSPALLLHVDNPNAVLMCSRDAFSRVRYAFCPVCIASQRIIHVHWEWGLAFLVCCGIHGTPLLEGCPACGDPNPLTFSSGQACRLCRSCGGDLGDAGVRKMVRALGQMRAVEDAYRAALLGIAPDPTLLGKATDRCFRLFVEDMLEILSRNLNPHSGWQNARPGLFPRQDITQIITQLIVNAAPSSDQSVRQKRYARGLLLWATLLKTISVNEQDVIERASLRWPTPLRRRFAAGLRYGTQRRWPNPPCRGTLGHWRPSEWERRELAVLYDLTSANRAEGIR